MARVPSLLCSLTIFATFLTTGIWGLNCKSIIAQVVPGQMTPSGDLKADGYTFPPDEFERINGTHFRVCMCSVRKCLRRCCPPGQAHLTVGKGCQNTSVPLRFNITSQTTKVVTEPFLSREFFFVYGNTCALSHYKLYPDTDKNDLYYIRPDGKLSMPNMVEGAKLLNYDQFCVCSQNTPDPNGQWLEEIVLVCFVPQADDNGSLYPIGMIISIPFLLATLCVYAILPELRNLHGKSLMCHVSSLTIGYVFLVAVQIMGKKVDRKFCVVAGFLTQFGFIASFLWLNVMSFDIWWTFSGLGGFKQRGRNRLKFILYSAYAWGGVAILMAVSLALDLSPNIPDYIVKPQIGIFKCWFRTQLGTLAYFYGPMAAIMVCNLLLFAATAYKIFVAKQEAQKVFHGEDSKKNNEANKQRFFLYLKLFLVMGVNWIAEVLSWAIGGPREVWYLTDVCNTLQGVLICWLFVGSAQTRELLVNKFRKSRISMTSRSTTGTNISNRHSRNS